MSDHALVEQVLERFLDVHQAEVVQHHGDEAGVQKMQDSVLDSADVLIDRHPALGEIAVEDLGVVLG